MRTMPALLALALFTSASAAQQSPPTDPTDRAAPPLKLDSAPAGDQPEQPRSRLTVTLTPRAEHTFEGDLQDRDGRSSNTRVGANLGVSYAATEQLRLNLGLDGEYSWYNFSGRDRFAGNRDLDGLLSQTVSIDITPGLAYAIDRQWTVIGGAIVQFEGEDDADVGDSATYGGFGAVRYAFSDTFALTLGAGAKTRLEDDTRFIPIVGLEWKLNSRIRLATERLGLRVGVMVTDQVEAWVAGGYELREFRLDDDHPFAPGGVARDGRVPIKFGLDWTPSRRFTLGGYAGVIVWQEYEFLDDHGRTLLKDNSDPAAVLGLRGRITF